MPISTSPANGEADTARRYLDICELEVLEPRFTDDFALKLLYEPVNKSITSSLSLIKYPFRTKHILERRIQVLAGGRVGVPVIHP